MTENTLWGFLAIILTSIVAPIIIEKFKNNSQSVDEEEEREITSSELAHINEMKALRYEYDIARLRDKMRDLARKVKTLIHFVRIEDHSSTYIMFDIENDIKDAEEDENRSKEGKQNKLG